MQKTKNFLSFPFNWKCEILIIILLLINSKSYSQDIESLIHSKPVTIGGNVNFNTNADFLSDSISTYYYLSGGLNTTFFGIVSVPISFALTNNTLTKNLALPFNRFSLNPSYKGYTVYAGYNSMNYSKYTMNGHEYFGGGADAKIDLSSADLQLNLSAFYGRLRKAVTPDSTTNDAGYKRLGGGFKIGVKKGDYEVVTNFIKIKDVENSVDFSAFPDQYVNPKDNIAGSIAGQFMLMQKLSLSAEYGFSQMTTLPQNKENVSDKVTWQAINAALSYQTEIGSFGVSYEFLPPNYETLGGYYFAEDQEQFAFNFSTQILEKISFSGDLGYNHDNVKKQKLSTNKDLAYSFNIGVSPTEKLQLSFSMNNDQNYVNLKDNYQQLVKMSEFEDLDTNNYSRLSSSMNLGINYQLPSNEVLNHSLFSNFSYQKTSDIQRYDTTTSDAKIYNVNLGYSGSLKVPNINFSANYGFNRSETHFQNLDIHTLSISIGKRFKENLSINAVYSFSNTISDTIKTEVHNAKLNANYTLFKNHNLGLSACYIRNPQSVMYKDRFALTFNYSYNFSLINATKNKQDEEVN